MSTLLKDLKITSTDLVDAGANPDAKISLFKRGATALANIFKTSAPVEVAKEAETFRERLEDENRGDICDQIWDFGYAFKGSLCSIIWDEDLTEDTRRDMMFQSLDEFAETLRGAIPAWAALKRYALGGESVEKCAVQKAALENLVAKFAPAVAAPVAIAPPQQTFMEKFHSNKNNHEKEDFNTMNIDKSRLTPEELIALEAIEKKYGTTAGDASEATPPMGEVAKSAEALPATEMHPEVKKALEENKALAAQMEEMKKSLEIKDLSILAKKYEIIGKKAEELAPKLYELKKSGGTAYTDFVELLDEQVNLVEKSNLMGEIGTARSNLGGSGGGSELDAKVADIRKGNPTMSNAAAIAKAYEENPELAAQYEATYTKGGN